MTDGRQTARRIGAAWGPDTGLTTGSDDASQARDIFLANISHELRTPLNGLVGMAELLERTELTAEQRAMVEVMRESGDALSRMLSDILDQAEIVSGRITLRSEPFALGHALRSAVGRAEGAAVRKGVEFRTRIEPCVERAVIGDAPRLQQIIASLADNAVKFTERGTVCISARMRHGGVCRIVVTDTGVGIHPAAKASVFDCFRQGDGSTTRCHDGLGLGLALARQLADLIGARLECRSVPGQGSAFILTMPVVAAAEPSTPPEAPAGHAAAPCGRAISVLVVDDHPVNRELLKLALAPTGARVVTAEDGAEACDLWTVDRFDLVVMDLHMPVMDGLSAIRRIRAAEASRGFGRTPVVVFTANATSEKEQASFRAGADHFLTKPLAPSELLATFQTILEPAGPDPAGVPGSVR